MALHSNCKSIHIQQSANAKLANVKIPYAGVYATSFFSYIISKTEKEEIFLLFNPLKVNAVWFWYVRNTCAIANYSHVKKIQINWYKALWWCLLFKYRTGNRKRKNKDLKWKVCPRRLSCLFMDKFNNWKMYIDIIYPKQKLKRKNVIVNFFG